MDIISRAYCKTHHAGRMWNSNPKMTRSSRKRVTWFPKSVTQLPKGVTQIPKNVTQFPQKKGWLIILEQQVFFLGNSVTFLWKPVHI